MLRPGREKTLLNKTAPAFGVHLEEQRHAGFHSGESMLLVEPLPARRSIENDIAMGELPNYQPDDLRTDTMSLELRDNCTIVNGGLILTVGDRPAKTHKLVTAVGKYGHMTGFESFLMTLC